MDHALNEITAIACATHVGQIDKQHVYLTPERFTGFPLPYGELDMLVSCIEGQNEWNHGDVAEISIKCKYNNKAAGIQIMVTSRIQRGNKSTMMLALALQPRKRSKTCLYPVRRYLCRLVPNTHLVSRISLQDIDSFLSQVRAEEYSLAGTPIHSAISSSIPSSPIHSSLQVYILLVPQHRAKLPFRTGFHRACKTGFVCMRILRNLGLNGSEAEGKEYMWMTVGTFSADDKRLVRLKYRKYGLTSPKRTSSKLPVLFHSSWTAPVLGFGFERSVRARLID
jgi:hypothetical protein